MYYLVFDVESKNIFDEVSGDDVYKELGISYMSYYRSDTDKIEGFFEDDVPKFKALMDNADMIIGYNIIGFDYPVLKAYFEFDEKKYNTCDLYKIIHDQHKIHLKLDNITTATLGGGKIAHGLDAIRFYREGQLDKLKEYCDSDVELTKNAYEFIKQNGFCYYIDGIGNKVKLEVNLNPSSKSNASQSTSADDGFGLF
jgi:DEAD/DEAH box helicase domain-containing protein